MLVNIFIVPTLNKKTHRPTHRPLPLLHRHKYQGSRSKIARHYIRPFNDSVYLPDRKNKHPGHHCTYILTALQVHYFSFYALTQ